MTDGPIMDAVQAMWDAEKAVIDAAWEAWYPCGDDPRWCTEHRSKPPCEMAVLGQALRALDPEKADQYSIPTKYSRKRGEEPS